MEQTNKQEMPEKGPWSLPWKEAAKAAGTYQSNQGKEEAPPPSVKKMPWEYSINEAVEAAKRFIGMQPPPKPSPIVVAPSKPLPEHSQLIPTEVDMKKATGDLFTPQANAKRTVQEKSSGNIAELKSEIDNTKDPKKKKILMDYLKSLGEK
jgi:hypothetical protein